MLWVDEEYVAEESPFNIYLKLPLKNEISISTSIIEGASMNMGYIPLFFEPFKKGVFKAKGMIGACETESMQWQINITFSEQQNLSSINLLLPN